MSANVFQYLTVLLISGVISDVVHAQDVIESGQGSYFEDVPKGRGRPAKSSGTPVGPAISGTGDGPVPTPAGSSS
ncbi:MAG: hypothetical protein VX641_00165, partial [Planctomycetota bacterium]|nr:hypothetical protein [Planctomycetota bacterium]